MLAGEAKVLHTAKRSSGVDVSDPALAEAWARVRQDSDPQTDWCAFHHAQGSNQVIALLGAGAGGRAEMCAALNDSVVAFCALRLGTDGDKKTPRFHRIMLVGADVGGMKKGRAALQKNAVFATFEGASAEDHVFNSLSELVEAPALS